MRLWWLGIFAFLFCGAAAFGDGCYFPQRAVRKIPDIVAQRAALSWKDGVETLLIASALDSQSQQLGWIIPVPAVPSTIEKATPGSLKTLDFCIQPQITHDLSQEVGETLVAVIVANLLVGTWLFKQGRFGCVGAAILALFILYSLLLPAVGTADNRAAKVSSVRVEKTATVGSYTVAVLRPEHAEGLNSWLAENGFAGLPEAAGPIVADYISQGWVFAAIKLTRSESGENTPHPIKLEFASKEPVYPMKLKRIAGGSPAFELFVIGKDRASCGMLREEFCDKFSQDTYNDYETDTRQTRLNGTETSCAVGHSAICPLMWDGCVLTKFSGTIEVAGMTKDLQFAWAPFKSHQDHYFTRRGARSSAVILFVLLVGIGNICSMWNYARGFVQPAGCAGFCVTRLLPVTVLAGLLAGGLYAILPKLSGADVAIGRYLRHRQRELTYRCASELEEHPEICRQTEPEIYEFLTHSLHEMPARSYPAKNPVTGAEYELEDTPGNFTIEKKKDEVILRVYQMDGSELTRTFSIPPAHNSNPRSSQGKSQ